MSLRDKYTDEEWDALMEKASESIRTCDNFDKVKFSALVTKATTKSSYDGDVTGINSNLLDERVVGGSSAYNSARMPLNHNDEVNRFGKVNLWDFSRGMNKDVDIQKIEPKDYKFAENISCEEMLAERIKKENMPREVIQNIFNKVYERKLNGNDSAVAIMSYSDYDAIQAINGFGIHSIEIMGYLLKIHPSVNAEDGNIEIY